ncbi:MAG: hypothetical protein ACFFD7_09205 [Candidatus Thorarchaeota archaeon]
MKIHKDRYNEEIEEIPEIKKYFSRIFTVLSKEIRDKLKELNLPTEKLKKIKNELAFLSKEKQETYINELLNHFN